ncbi:MAG: NUDIX domain-containing protein [Prolixibacteraceae bacterium]|jgi:8-oxo-dGTP pyrophosphatase MutT (NUDIX family)|nr:NUDIX domain-containing protein [Prolixibacteraceae bacterium]
MYKVFFNGSSLALCTEFENSSKNNKYQIIDNEYNIDFYSLIINLERKKEPENIVLVCPNPEELWNKFRKHFIEITAAGGIVTDRYGHILVIRRLGCWDLPKGKVEKGETTEEAAIREVEEECSISGLQISDKLGSMFHMYRSPFHPPTDNFVLKETFWFEMEYQGNEKPQPQYSENIEEVCWMDRNEFSLFFSNTYPNLEELMKTYLQKTSGKAG